MKNKTYIWTLTLFVLFINLGIMLFCTVNTKRNFAGLKESYLREHYILASNLTKDIKVFDNEWNTVEESITYACDSYKDQYRRQGIYLQMYKDGEEACLYSSFPDALAQDRKLINDEKEMTIARVLKLDDRKYMQIVGHLFNQYNDYLLVYYADITDVVSGWQNMNTSLFMAGIVVCVILSICLFELLKYIFAPLEEISSVSKKIAGGEYTHQLEIKGGEEISEVVQSFNTMSSQIRSQMEALEEHVKGKQRLIDDMAHELRTPLTAIYGYTEYMIKAHLTEEERYTFLNYILSESKRLKNISENMLEMAVIREEKEIEMKEIEVIKLFKKIHQTENIKLKEKEIQFSYETTVDKLIGNADLMESLVMNLVDNAIKACQPKGKVEMYAYVMGEHKIIEIKDNGKGMTTEQLQHVKEAFYRVDKSRSRKEGGNGLGLALCEQIAKKHGAELCIESKAGQGTSVKIIF